MTDEQIEKMIQDNEAAMEELREEISATTTRCMVYGGLGMVAAIVVGHYIGKKAGEEAALKYRPISMVLG